MIRARSHSAASNRRSVLRLLAVVWGLVIMSLSLYPFEGWRWPHQPPWDFLLQPLPRYRTPFDLWTNLLAYVPLGILIAGALPARARAGSSILIAVGMAGLLSITMEFAQAFLPPRRAQWLDLVANLSGGGLGALVWLSLSRAQALPSQGSNPRVLSATPGWWSLGPLLVLLLIWWFAQASPMPLWLSMGVSPLWGWGPWLLVANESGWHILFETLMVGLSLASLCLLIACSLSPEDSRWGHWVERHPSGAIGLTLLGAVSLRLVWVALLGPTYLHPIETWLSPGVQAGLVLAGLLSAAAVALGPIMRVLALIGLLGSGLALSQSVSLLGPLPSGVWAAGPWFNLRGLAQVSATLWPFLALGWALVLLLQRHNRRL